MVTSCFLIAEHISARLWMRIYSWDVHMYVHVYICTCWSCLGMSIFSGCTEIRNVNLARNVNLCSHQEHRHHWYVNYTMTLGQLFLAMKNGENSMAGPSWHMYMYLVEQVQKWVLECSQCGLATLRKKKGKEVSSKVESTYRWVFTCQVLGSLFTLLLFCTVFWAPTINQQRTTSDTCSEHPTCMRNTSYVCIPLVYLLILDVCINVVK